MALPITRCLAILAGLAALSAGAYGQASPKPKSLSQPIIVAQSATKIARAKRAPLVKPSPAQASAEAKRKEAINSWTVGLAAGRTEGAPLRFAAELARVLDDGDNMRVLPIVTRGPFDNIFDLLYLRGVDAAIVYSDILEHFKKNPEIAGIEKRINFLISLFPSELHVFVRPEIKTLADLNGKPVNFNTKGTAAAYSGPIMLERLGIKVDAKFVPHTVAMEEMKKSDTFAATVWVSAKPLQPFLKGNFPPGFKFLPVEYNDKLDYYLPSYLDHADYPQLIPEGQRIPTISVPALLAVYDWPVETDRYRRMVRFIDYLIERFPKLQTDPGYHPKWKDVSLAANIPGWQRYKPLQDKLDLISQGGRPVPLMPGRAAEIDSALARRQVQRAAPGNAAEQERLFRQFLEWSRQQPRKQ
jgi:TRAP-type uncharacterized transport system substrate-binding protein